MSKRGRDTLTGGTGDVNPQWYKITLSQPTGAADTLTNQQFQLPVTRIPRARQVTIMEFLKVAWFHNHFATPAGQLSTSVTGVISTANSATLPSITDGSIIAQQTWQQQTNFVGASSYVQDDIQPVIQDLTDGQGHGLLVATDQINFWVASNTTGQSNTVTAWILYRFKSVGIEEYVGIVQGQSNL